MRGLKLAAALAFAMTFLITTAAVADPITGGFSIAGGFTPVLSDGTATDIASATAVDFDPNTFTVISRSGTFASYVNVGDTGSIRDFSFTGPGSLAFPATPVSGFQTLDGFTFDLTGITDFSQGGDVLTVHGTGIFSGNGFDATNGTFTFSGQGNTWGDFSFSASEGTTGVPEPASLTLLGMGFFGAGVFGRRRKAA